MELAGASNETVRFVVVVVVDVGEDTVCAPLFPLGMGSALAAGCPPGCSEVL